MSYFFWEIKVFFANKKNLLILFILFVTSLYYALYVASEYDSIEKVDPVTIQARYDERADFLENVDLNDNSHALTMFAVSIFPEWNEYDLARLEALESNDLTKYAEATANWYSYSDRLIYGGQSEFLRYNRQYYTYGNRFAHIDGHYAYVVNSLRYEAYAEADYPLTLDLFNERTALQTLERLMGSTLPYILLMMTLLLCNDIVTRDRRHGSIVNGFPKTPFTRLIVKGLAAFCAILISYVVFVPAFVALGLMRGFGSLSLPVITYEYEFLTLGHYDTMTMGTYLAQILLLVVMWNIIIIGLILLFSILFKNEFINLIIVAMFFIEKIHYQRGGLIDEQLAYLPTSYVQFGNIITGYLNFYIDNGSPVYTKGLMALGATIVLVGLLIGIVSRFKRKLV